jgi:hypothetical protein
MSLASENEPGSGPPAIFIAHGSPFIIWRKGNSAFAGCKKSLERLIFEARAS